MKNKLIISKFGGGVFGINGENIPLVIDRIKKIKKQCEIGPLIIVSAPKTYYKNKVSSITDVAMDIGNEYANFNPVSIDPLINPYIECEKMFIAKQYKKQFNNELYKAKQKINRALNQILDNRRCVDVNRSRLLAYSGEMLMNILMSYVMKSNGLKSTYLTLKNWPIITDDEFENANFLLSKSQERVSDLKQMFKNENIPCIGGYIGMTEDGLETTYERGGSDRTAVNLSMLLHNEYNIILDFEKEGVVLNTDPKIVKTAKPVFNLSYNEAHIASRFGMKILDPFAVRELRESGMDVPVILTNVNNPKQITTIDRTLNIKYSENPNWSGKSTNPIKIVTGKNNCAIIELNKKSRDTLENFIIKVKRYREFIELMPYEKYGNEYARYLFLDGNYIKRHEREFKSFNSDVNIRYNLAAITLVGDQMGETPGIMSIALGPAFKSGINIEDAVFLGPQGGMILLIIKEGELRNIILSIHNARSELE
tara:strand:- start:704 stop:2149 length:1446 start_codon:yes stop_codon:yes gene_type:complete